MCDYEYDGSEVMARTGVAILDVLNNHPWPGSTLTAGHGTSLSLMGMWSCLSRLLISSG